MERGFIDSGVKKKKEGISKVVEKKKKDGGSLGADETPILGGIAMRVMNINGKMNVPKSILKKAPRNVVSDTHKDVKPINDGGSASKVSFEAVENKYAKPCSPTALANSNGPKIRCLVEAVGDPSVKDGGTEYSPKSGGSFASLLKTNDATNKVHFRTFVNEERVESADCVLLKDAATKYVSNTWRKFGFERIIRNDDGVYLFKFATKSGRDQVIEKGSWMIRKSPIILSKCSPSVTLKRGEVTKVPVWVKLYNVPVLAYSEDGLSLIGTQIRKPILLDAFTISMCVESWGRISFARALIEIDAAVGLKKEVIMAILEEEGDGYIKEVVRVEYEWKPPHCVDCKSFGHDTNLCLKRVREEGPKNLARDAKTTTMEENDDGFTKVMNHKKNKGANFGRIRLNKPKSKVMWQQKKGVDAKTSSCASSNEAGNDDTTDDEDVFTSYGGPLGGGNQLKDEDFDFYEGYTDQVVDLDGALKEFCDF
nr:hypothetical protein [Tanacetum cinerariifolium]